MNNLVKQDRDRLKLFKKYGYDIPRARKFILTKAKISEGRILEVGTGRGHMAVTLAKNGLKVVSIDLDKRAQKTAKLKFKSLKLNLPKYQWTIVDAKTKTRFLAWSYTLTSFYGLKFLQTVVLWLRAHNIRSCPERSRKPVIDSIVLQNALQPF